MARRRLVLLPESADVLRRLPPATKRKVRAALEALRDDPDLGEPLERELTGLRRVRVGQHRVIFRSKGASLEVVAIGPRATIYADLEREARAQRADK